MCKIVHIQHRTGKKVNWWKMKGSYLSMKGASAKGSVIQKQRCSTTLTFFLFLQLWSIIWLNVSEKPLHVKGKSKSQLRMLTTLEHSCSTAWLCQRKHLSQSAFKGRLYNVQGYILCFFNQLNNPHRWFHFKLYWAVWSSSRTGLTPAWVTEFHDLSAEPVTGHWYVYVIWSFWVHFSITVTKNCPALHWRITYSTIILWNNQKLPTQ